MELRKRGAWPREGFAVKVDDTAAGLLISVTPDGNTLTVRLDKDFVQQEETETFPV